MIKSNQTIAIFDRSITKYITGGSRRRIEIANRLAQRGWKVTMYTFDAEPISSRWYPIQLKVPLEKRIDGIKANFIICGDLFDDPLETKEGTFLTAQAINKKIWLMQLDRASKHLPVLKDSSIYKVAVSTHMSNLITQKYQQRAYRAIGGVDTVFFHHQPEPKDFLILTYKSKSRVEKESWELNYPSIDNSCNQIELRHKYWNCMVFLSSEFADFYGWCNPIAEAMACGRACVAVDSPHVRDIIINEETGLLAKPEVQHIVKQINKIRDKKFRDRIVRNGLEHIKQFNWERVVDSLEKYM